MPIQVSCQCGQQLSAKDEYAGRRVKCPGCGGPLLIPQPQAAEAAEADDGITGLLDDAGVRAGVNRCMGCGAEMADEAVLCVMCGFDQRRGHRLKARVGSAAEMDDEELGELPVHGVSQLDEAERRLARDKIQQSKLGKGVPWWMILLAFLGVVGFAAGMVAMPQDLVVRNSGYVLIVAGALMAFFFSLQLLIMGFKESVLAGILMLFTAGIFGLYFVFSRWDRAGGLFLLLIFGVVMCASGVGMVVFLVPFFDARKEGSNHHLRMWQNQPVAVKTFHDPAHI